MPTKTILKISSSIKERCPVALLRLAKKLRIQRVAKKIRITDKRILIIDVGIFSKRVARPANISPIKPKIGWTKIPIIAKVQTVKNDQEIACVS